MLLLDCYVGDDSAVPNFLPHFDGAAVRSPLREPLPDPRELRGLVISGSAASVLDTDPWVQTLLDFVARAVEVDVPVLGVCFGHQVLAAACWGRQAVRSAPTPEIGFLEVRRVADAGPVLNRLPERFVPFVTHQDEVLRQSEMQVLASSNACEVHAFGVPGRRAWGVQFHTEMGAAEQEHILRWRAVRHPELELDPEHWLARRVETRPLAEALFAGFRGIVEGS